MLSQSALGVSSRTRTMSNRDNRGLAMEVFTDTSALTSYLPCGDPAQGNRRIRHKHTTLGTRRVPNLGVTGRNDGGTGVQLAHQACLRHTERLLLHRCQGTHTRCWVRKVLATNEHASATNGALHARPHLHGSSYDRVPGFAQTHRCSTRRGPPAPARPPLTSTPRCPSLPCTSGLHSWSRCPS